MIALSVAQLGHSLFTNILRPVPSPTISPDLVESELELIFAPMSLMDVKGFVFKSINC